MEATEHEPWPIPMSMKSSMTVVSDVTKVCNDVYATRGASSLSWITTALKMVEKSHEDESPTEIFRPRNIAGVPNNIEPIQLQAKVFIQSIVAS